MEKPLLIFDYDGTLVDSLDESILILNKLAKKHGVWGRLNRRTYREMMHRSITENFKYYKIPITQLPFLMSEFKNEFEKANKTIKLVSGIKPILKKLAKKCELIIVTSNHSDLAKKTMDKQGLSKEFSQIIGSNNEKKKFNALKKFRKRFPGRKIFYIGDTSADIREAMQANVISVAVAWGFQPIESLKKQKPDYVINAPKQLLKATLK